MGMLKNSVQCLKIHFKSKTTFMLSMGYAVHLRTKITDNKMIFEFQKQDDRRGNQINEVEIAAFEHQSTNYSNPMTHFLKFKFTI